MFWKVAIIIINCSEAKKIKVKTTRRLENSTWENSRGKFKLKKEFWVGYLKPRDKRDY